MLGLNPLRHIPQCNEYWLGCIRLPEKNPSTQLSINTQSLRTYHQPCVQQSVARRKRQARKNCLGLFGGDNQNTDERTNAADTYISENVSYVPVLTLPPGDGTETGYCTVCCVSSTTRQQLSSLCKRGRVLRLALCFGKEKPLDRTKNACCCFTPLQNNLN